MCPASGTQLVFTINCCKSHIVIRLITQKKTHKNEAAPLLVMPTISMDTCITHNSYISCVVFFLLSVSENKCKRELHLGGVSSNQAEEKNASVNRKHQSYPLKAVLLAIYYTYQNIWFVVFSLSRKTLCLILMSCSLIISLI